MKTLDGQGSHSIMASTVELAARDHEKPPGRDTAKKGGRDTRKSFAGLKFTAKKGGGHTRESGAGLKFITKKGGGDTGWPEVEREFDRLTAETDGLLHSSAFGECLGMEEASYGFGEALFYALARLLRVSGDSITKEDLRCFWDMIADQNFDTRLINFLIMVDKDFDGRITPDDLKEIIILSASANKLSIKQKANEYSTLIMDKLDPDGCGYIMIEDLKTLLQEGPEEADRPDSQYISHQLSEMLKTRESNSWYRRFKYFIADHWRRVWVMMLWLAACLTLFIYKFVEYRYKEDPFAVMGYCVCVAKGGAETLKLNMALILLPVCRNTITWLRNKTRLGAVVPFDDNLNFHKVIAVGVVVGVILHAGAHLTCDFPRILLASDQKYEEHLARYLGQERPGSYWWFVKGWEGVTGILMIVLMAVAFTLATPWLRRNTLKENLEKKLEKLREQNKNKTVTVLNIVLSVLKTVTGFNAFWYTHHLFVIVYALLVIHGIKLYFTTDKWQKTTWMYIAVPMTLYAIERLIRVFRSTIKPVKVLVAAHYPGNLLALKMSKPPGFEYKSGQYMFVNCPKVSPFEWHPFSITSSPGDDHLGVHIRVLGDWTERIKHVFQSASKDNLEYPGILIDGAYGAPAQEYKKYDIVLLIGLGIGATPMISIVKDIINNRRTIEEEDQALESGTRGSPKKEVFETQRAYFYWVTGQQGTFEWFKGVMNEVEEIDERKVIEMHNYCSSVYEESDARSALIGKLQALHYAKTGEDLVSRTRVKTHFAKPDWRKVYDGIALHHPGKTVGVFYCGPAGAVKEQKDLALDFSRKTATKFDFHKENF